MQIIIKAALMAFTAFSFLSAQEIVVPVKDSIGIYRTRLFSSDGEPLGKAGIADSLLTLTQEGCCLVVERGDGLIGWVKSYLVASTGKRKSLKCRKPLVMGYINGPTPIYFVDDDHSNDDPIELDSSFRAALRRNSDPETEEDCNEQSTSD